MNSENYNIAKQMIEYYGLHNPIIEKCFVDDDIQAFFSFDDGSIQICSKRLENITEYKKALLHEIKHAIDAQEMSLSKFDDAYNNEYNRLEAINRDAYWENPYEIKAEKFAEKEINIWI